MTQAGMPKFMNKIMPIANALEKQKHLQSIKEGMIQTVPIVIIGSIFLIPLAIMNLLGSGPIHAFILNHLSVLTYAAAFTSDLISVFVVLFIAQALAKRYGIEGNSAPINALIVHLMLSTTIADGILSVSYLGASGIFTAIVSAILTVEIYHLCFAKKIYIKLPSTVPSMVGQSFAALIPFIISVIVAVAIATISMNLTGTVFSASVMNLLAPAISGMDSLPALLIVIFLTQFLWFFGLHGPSITSAVWAPFAITYGAENIANYAAGEPVTHIFTFGLYYAILQVSGSGMTLGLNAMMIRSKAKSLSALGKAGIVPSIFGINEPIIFGAPIILNPFMFIPFVFGPLIMTTITYFSMTSGLVGMPIANPPGFLPPGVGAYLMTFDWKSVVLVFALLALMTLIYFPFFKAMEADELKKEAEAEAATEK